MSKTIVEINIYLKVKSCVLLKIFIKVEHKFLPVTISSASSYMIKNKTMITHKINGFDMHVNVVWKEIFQWR